MKVSEFLQAYAALAAETKPKEVSSFSIDGDTDEPVGARARFEAEGETFWVTVRRLPSDI